jgi:hypothetical protein
MLRFLRLAALALVALAVPSCATTMNVGSHVQRGLDFARFHTYDWGLTDALPPGDTRLAKNPFFRDYVQGAVERQLAARGFHRSPSNRPDLVIRYQASINDRIDIDRLDQRYGYCSTDDCRAGVSKYEAGTLVLDIVDTRTNELIWRGWAQDTVEDWLENQRNMAQRIDEAVRRMFAMLPKGVER